MRIIDADELERVAVTVDGRLVVYLTDIHNAPTIEITDYDMGYQDGLEDGLNDIRPQGKWIDHQGLFFECTICKYKTAYGGNFCPNCGAKMDGKDADDETN